MYQVLTEEEYDEFKIKDRVQAMYFTFDEQLVTVGAPNEMREDLFNYIKEHVEDWADDKCYYVLDIEHLKAIMMTKVNMPLLKFMASIHQDPQN